MVNKTRVRERGPLALAAWLNDLPSYCGTARTPFLQAEAFRLLRAAYKCHLERELVAAPTDRAALELLLAWLIEHCSNLLLVMHKGEPHDGHTAYMRLKGKP